VTRRIDVDTEAIIREYQAGLSGTKIARALGVSPIVVYKRLSDSGVQMRPSGAERLVMDAADIAAYVAGESEKSISDRIGWSRRAIRRCLTEAGVAIRGQSEAEKIRWSRMTPEQRERQVVAAHDATRGIAQPFERQVKKAKTIQEKMGNVSPAERRLRSMLDERGMETIPQEAIGPYNCDLGAFPVAVEVWGGGWHWHGRHAARVDERFRYILRAGWHLLVLSIGRDDPLSDELVDYVVTYIDQVRDRPDAIREYHLVWNSGKITTSGRADDAEVSIAKPTWRANN